MKFYDDTKPLYLETDTSGISLGAALLQLRENTTCQPHIAPNDTIICPITFVSKGLMGAVCRYSNIKCETLGILHGLEKFQHYCFGREVLVITDYKPLVSMFKKDVATLSQCIQCILLKSISAGSRSYINLALRFSLQIGYQDITTGRERINQ